MTPAMPDFIPRLPVGSGIEAIIDFMVEHFAFITKGFSKIVDVALDGIETAMLWPHPLVMALLLAALAWYLSKRKGIAAFTFFGLLFIWNIGLWQNTMSTIALVIIATCIAIMIGVPIGIASSMSETIYRIVMPILDVMQTMPAFVYLIPAIPFFGLGKVAAIFSTVVFSMPPAIRLTCLGIKQVPKELVECADAFGSDRWQKLFKLELPLATPTIMAGVNQTVMLALSMVVIAAMIGAKGLGGEVWKAIQRLQTGHGFEAGIGIVIVAIILDRVLQRVGAKR